MNKSHPIPSSVWSNDGMHRAKNTVSSASTTIHSCCSKVFAVKAIILEFFEKLKYWCQRLPEKQFPPGDYSDPVGSTMTDWVLKSLPT